MFAKCFLYLLDVVSYLYTFFLTLILFLGIFSPSILLARQRQTKRRDQSERKKNDGGEIFWENLKTKLYEENNNHTL